MEKILDMASITRNKNAVPGESILVDPMLHFPFPPIVLGLAFHPLRVHLTPAYVEYKGEKSALVPGGIRIGSPAMTTRGFTEKVFVAIADFIHEGVEITLDAKRSASGSKLQDFMKFVTSHDFPLVDRVSDLRSTVEALTTKFPMPGL